MCGDCGDGTCLDGTTICVCNGVLTQSVEFFKFSEANLNCTQEDITLCLPCDTNKGAIAILYALALAAVCCVLVVFLIAARPNYLLYLRRKIVLFLGCLMLAVALALRVADESRVLGEDVTFTAIYVGAIILAVNSFFLGSDRFFSYMLNTLFLKSSNPTQRRIIMICKYTNYTVCVVLLVSVGLPVAAAAQPDLMDKSEYVTSWFLILFALLAYLSVVYLVVYQRLIRDMEYIVAETSGEHKRNYLLGVKKLRVQRLTTIFAILPIGFLMLVFAVSSDVYRAGRYLWPVINIFHALLLFGSFLYKFANARRKKMASPVAVRIGRSKAGTDGVSTTSKTAPTGSDV